MALFLALFLAPFTVSAVRTKVDLMEHLKDVAGLASFETWAESNCPDCGTVLNALLRGVEQAGFLESASFDDMSLQVKLKEEKLYGEIASASNVPGMWQLDQELQFNISQESSKTRISVSGLHLVPPKQSQTLYTEALTLAGLDGSTCKDDQACVQAEVDAMYAYFKSHRDDITKGSKKLSILFKKAYGNTAIYLAMKAKEGDIGWGKALYGICVAVPKMHFQSLIFEEGLMSAEWEQDKDGEFFATNNFFEKKEVLEEMKYADAKKMGITPATAMKMQATAMKMFPGIASSSLLAVGGLMRSDFRHFNLEKIKEFGFTEDYLLQQRPAPKSVAKLMSFCSSSAPGEDPKCKGKTPGRVSWGPSVPATMS